MHPARLDRLLPGQQSPRGTCCSAVTNAAIGHPCLASALPGRSPGLLCVEDRQHLHVKFPFSNFSMAARDRSHWQRTSIYTLHQVAARPNRLERRRMPKSQLSERRGLFVCSACLRCCPKRGSFGGLTSLSACAAPLGCSLPWGNARGSTELQEEVVSNRAGLPQRLWLLHVGDSVLNFCHRSSFGFPLPPHTTFLPPHRPALSNAPDNAASNPDPP